LFWEWPTPETPARLVRLVPLEPRARQESRAPLVSQVPQAPMVPQARLEPRARPGLLVHPFR